MKKIIKDNRGRKINRWEILSLPIAVEKSNRKKYYLDCRCKCGTEKRVLESSILTGVTKSCGCLQKETAKERWTFHGMCESKEYSSWAGMKARCNSKSDVNYKNYGGRGITYDPKWETFEGFYEDMGPSNGLSLERIDVDKNYCKSNCCWVNRIQQGRNKRTTQSYKINKELMGGLIKDLEANKLTFAEIADKYELSPNLIASVQFALETYQLIKEIKED